MSCRCRAKHGGTPLSPGWEERWNQLVQAFAQHVHIGSKTSVAAGDIILALAACVVIVTAVRLIARAVRESAAAASVHAIPPHVSARTLYAQSLRHAAQGSYATAITLLFRSSVAALDLQGIVHDEPSLTVNEYRREVRSRASRFAEPFDTIARIFTSAVYAEAPVTPALWDCAHQAYIDLVPAQADAA